MRNAHLHRTSLSSALLGSILAAGCQGITVAEQYPRIAPIEQYLIADSGAEIAMARTAAPESITQDATVLILGTDGYRTALNGKDGFTCLVERSWMSSFDSTEFWNPKIRGPVCYNPAAVRTVLPYTLRRTKMFLAGLSKEQVRGLVRRLALPRKNCRRRRPARCLICFRRWDISATQPGIGVLT